MAEKRKLETFRERLALQPCPVGLRGRCCKNCLLGPCRFLTKNSRGICGADADTVTARNILRFVAGGASAHVGHAFHLLSYLGKKYPLKYVESKAPSYLLKTWNRLGIVPRIRFEHFKDISEALHASTMGMSARYDDLVRLAMKLGIVDGYYGLYLATELEDETYGKPKPRTGFIDLGVIDEAKTNIVVHGHEPMLAEALAKEAAKFSDVNLVGVCCTGASLLARHGIPLAANVLLQEDVIASGAIEAYVVDVQCVMPSLANLVECYHTKLITTNELARMPNALHLPVTKGNATIVAKKIIALARRNKKFRRETKISRAKKAVTCGFTPESLPLKRIAEKIKRKEIKGIIAVIGCTNPRVKEDWVSFYRKLSKNYVILTTGCMAFKLGQAGLLDGKHFFHMGSCVNNARIAETFRQIAELNKCEITDLPFLASFPEPITEKSIAIGFFFATIGVDVHFGYPFLLESATDIAGFLERTLRKDFKSRIFLETNPSRLLARIRTGLAYKR